MSTGTSIVISMPVPIAARAALSYPSVALWVLLFPELRRIDRMVEIREGIQPEESPSTREA